MLASLGADVELLDDDVVFRVTQGSEFLLLRGEEPNPSVWQFVAGASDLAQVSGTFTEFVLDGFSAE